MHSEFELIRRYFRSPSPQRPDVVLGVGDDGALLRPSPGSLLTVTLDMLVAGTHFLADADPEGIGHKALAVNLSDLAAMAAEPAWATLAIAMPEPDERWLEGFCRGLFGLASRFQVQLVGGDTTRGPLTITIQAHGFVPEGMALRRDGARPGDIICVTGTLGDAALFLHAMNNPVTIPSTHSRYLQDRLERPFPRIIQGIDLRGLASATIDISDGLGQDLGHILACSGVGARVTVDRLPLSPALKACLHRDEAIAMALGGGDDYELCFTVPPCHREQVQTLAAQWSCPMTEIGIIEAEPGLRCQRQDGTLHSSGKLGYDHFL